MTSKKTVEAELAGKQQKPVDPRREALRKELAAKLADRLSGDAFWAADFFALVHSIQEATKDGELEDPTLLYGLLDAVIETEDRPSVIKVVGKDTKSVFTFLTEVISSQDVASDAGDSLGE